MMNRRFLLKSSGLALAGMVAPPLFLRRAAASVEAGRGKVLVALFQRGAVDGLNMVVPYGEDRYYELRPNLAIPRPGKGEGAAVKLDDRFGLHPAMEALQPLWENKSLAIVHAVGSPDPTRSHFDAQDYMESGTPGDKGTQDGWLNRYLTNLGAKEPSPLRAVSIGDKTARTMQGEAAAVALQRINEFQLAGGMPMFRGAFRALYGERADQEVERRIQESSAETFEALRLVEEVRAKPYQPANGARYPQGQFGQKLRQIAQLIKADVGLQVAFADSGGWDTHTNQTPQLQNLLGEFAESVAAFVADMGDRMQDITVVSMSEFGRTARENGTRGTDHGHGNAFFLVGGAVKGGKIYGEWPGLADDQLYQTRDLAVTTDFRDVFSEILTQSFGAKDLRDIFPGYRAQRKLGLIKA